MLLEFIVAISDEGIPAQKMLVILPLVKDASRSVGLQMESSI